MGYARRFHSKLLVVFWTLVHYSVKELNIELLTTPNSTVPQQDAIEASLGSTVCHCTFLGILDILTLCMLGNFACVFVVRHFFFINDFGSRSGPEVIKLHAQLKCSAMIKC